MKVTDIKTLVTSGTIIIAVALYLIFAPPADESDTSTNDQVQTEEQSNVLTYTLTTDTVVEATGNKLIDVDFISANDGDTLKVTIDGREQRIRLLMIDTPEMNYDKGDPMPYAEQAKQFTTDLLKNANSVQIIYDVGPAADHYDRLLTYVFADGVLLQEALLREGLAAVRFINEPNNTLEDEFRTIQKEAENEKRYIWAHEDYFQKDGFHAENIK